MVPALPALCSFWHSGMLDWTHLVYKRSGRPSWFTPVLDVMSRWRMDGQQSRPRRPSADWHCRHYDRCARRSLLLSRRRTASPSRA